MEVIKKNIHNLLSKIATNGGHGENSPYFDGWKAYDSNPFHSQHNYIDIIQMGLAENQANQTASIFTQPEAFDFKGTAIFHDYHGLSEFRTVIANFMSQVHGNHVTIDLDRIIMSGDVISAHETVAFYLANPDEAFLVPTLYYPGFDRDLRWQTGVQLLPVVCESSNNFTSSIVSQKTQASRVFESESCTPTRRVLESESFCRL